MDDYKLTIPIEIGRRGSDRKVRFDFMLDLSTPFDRYVYEHYKQNYCYESEVAIAIMHVLKEGDFAIDVGANNGLFTLMMSRLVGERGTVAAFEPLQQNAAVLKANILLNDMNNIGVIPMPLSDREGSATFWISSDDTSSSCLWDPGLWTENEKSRETPIPTDVKTTTLDMCFSVSIPTLIKVDTEGADHKVLQGAERLLREKVPYIIVEMNPFGMQQMQTNEEQFRLYMKSFGYDLFILHPTDQFPTFVPIDVPLRYERGVVVRNVMFSTLEFVAQAWTEAVP